MFKLGKRIISIALLLMISVSLAACGGSATPTPAPTSTTAAAAVPSATTAAMAAPTDTTAAMAVTSTTAMAAPTDTAAAMGVTSSTLPLTATASISSSSGSGSGGAASGGAASSDDLNLLQQAVGDMKALKSYHMDIATGSAAQSVTMGADVDVANNKLKMDTSAAGQNISIVAIGSDVYMSTDGGKTYFQSPSSGQLTQSLSSFVHMWDKYNASTATTMTNALKEGVPASEQIDGIDTKHFIVDSAAFNGAAGNSQGTVELWISTDSSPTIRQLKASSTTAGNTTNVTVKWSKFNEDLNITAPAK